MSLSINYRYLLGSVRSAEQHNREVEKSKCWEARSADASLEALSSRTIGLPPSEISLNAAFERERNAREKSGAMFLRASDGTVFASREGRGERLAQRSSSVSSCSTCTCSLCSEEERRKRREKRKKRRRGGETVGGRRAKDGSRRK